MNGNGQYLHDNFSQYMPYNGFAPDVPVHLPEIVTTVKPGVDIFAIKPNVISTEHPELVNPYSAAPTTSASSITPMMIALGVLALFLMFGRGRGGRLW